MTNSRAYMREWYRNHRERTVLRLQVWHKKHPSYSNWNSMMMRCYNPNKDHYYLYGGRGITVYAPWHTFSAYENDFGYTKPKQGYSVDRIDNDGPYEPNNVRWATHKEQQNNRRNNQRTV